MTEKKRSRSTGKKTNPQAINAAIRDAEALRLRAQDWTYPEIAEHLGYDSKASAYNAVQKRLTEHKAEAVDELRQIEDLKLARGFQEVFRILNDEVDLSTLPKDLSITQVIENVSRIVAADQEIKLKAIDRLDKLSGRRARLLGLEAPQKTELTGAGGFPISINPNLLPDSAVQALARPPADDDETGS